MAQVPANLGTVHASSRSSCPCFNEVENLFLLWPELIGVLDANWRHVDDMSTDGSADRIRELEQLGGGRRDLATHRQRPRST